MAHNFNISSIVSVMYTLHCSSEFAMLICRIGMLIYKRQSKLELPLSQAMVQSLEEYCIYVLAMVYDYVLALP